MSVIPNIGEGCKDPIRGNSLLVKDKFAEELPGLFELLTVVKYKGATRKAAKLTLYAEPGRATLCLADAETGQVAFYAKEGFSEALLGLEGALQDGSLDWRPDKKSRWAK
jgi:hypothetical protein